LIKQIFEDLSLSEGGASHPKGVIEKLMVGARGSWRVKMDA